MRAGCDPEKGPRAVDAVADVEVEVVVDVDGDGDGDVAVVSYSPTELRQHPADSFEQFAASCVARPVDNLQEQTHVERRGALHRGPPRDSEVASGVRFSRSARGLGDVQRDGGCRPAQLVDERCMSAGDAVGELDGERQELDGTAVDVHALEAEHRWVPRVVGPSSSVQERGMLRGDDQGHVAVAVAVAVNNHDDHVNVVVNAGGMAEWPLIWTAPPPRLPVNSVRPSTTSCERLPI